MKRIIFHHPLPLNPNATSASGIRPQRILQAFRELGFQVDLVTGYAKERKTAINKIKTNIREGVKYDFLYSESSTMPTTLTEKHHFPTHPFLDSLFFRFCKKNNIPIGLFYRDIYWAFEEYSKDVSVLKSLIAKLAYRADLLVYEKYVTNLYLPSLEMGKYVPYVSRKKFVALPPGHTAPEKINITERKSLKLFYVGGLSNHYQLHKLFAVLSDYRNIEFTLCTRESEWLTMRDEYPIISKNIKIIHKSSTQMEEDLIAADIAILYVKPQEYREFAAPVKLFEYLGYRKPILASNGTLAGRFVSENDIGWSIEYDEHSLRKFLDELQKNPDAITDKLRNIDRVAPRHSWIARAEQVAKELTQ